MLNRLIINNFKSIKKIEIDPSKINLFIGEPNTGKTNILESIGLLNSIQNGDIKKLIRCNNLMDLYNDFHIDIPIIIENNEFTYKLVYNKNKFNCNILIDKIRPQNLYEYDYYGNLEKAKMSVEIQKIHEISSKYKFYNYVPLNKFENRSLDFLISPNGENLSTIIIKNYELREIIDNIFKKFNYKFVIEEPERDIKILKEDKNILILLPYTLFSDTLKRLVFYLTAIYSNKKAVICLNEPESHAFPFYTKYLAEIIAENKNNNQFFITTHNLYFLRSIIEKGKKEDIRIYTTYLKNYETQIKALSSDEINAILNFDFDPFFNIDKYETE